MASNKSKRTVAVNGWQKGAVASNENINACTMAGDYESRQRTMEQMEDDKAYIDAITNH